MLITLKSLDQVCTVSDVLQDDRFLNAEADSDDA